MNREENQTDQPASTILLPTSYGPSTLLMHHYGAQRGVGCVSGRFNITAGPGNLRWALPRSWLADVSVIRRNVRFGLSAAAVTENLTGWSVAPAGRTSSLCRSAPTRVRFFPLGNRKPVARGLKYTFMGTDHLRSQLSLAFMVQAKYRRVGWHELGPAVSC